MKHDERPAISPPVPIAPPGRDKAKHDAEQAGQDAKVAELARKIESGASGARPKRVGD